MKTIKLTFDGYWMEVNKGGVPAESGVYCVYACTYNSSADTVSLRKLIYVGESVNARKRIESHERFYDWKKNLLPGETLCYSFAPVQAEDRLKAEAIIIYKHKPVCNIEYKRALPFYNVEIVTDGHNSMIEKRLIA